MGLNDIEKKPLFGDIENNGGDGRALFPQHILPQSKNVEIRREKMGFSGNNIKVIVLVWLVFQNSFHTLLLRYSRAREVKELFYSSVAVFFTEVIKAIFCFYAVYAEENGLKGAFRTINQQLISQPWDTLKVCVPAMLYIVQNNLFYAAASHLEAATFMVVSQLKIFATALFSVVLLKRQLNKFQWVSLAILFTGVSFVQLQGSSSSTKVNHEQNPVFGFTCACVACGISGFAGVFFEKILKGSAPVSIWMRNLQMGVFAIPASFAAILVQDGANVMQNGFLYGFDGVVWLAVVWYGVGGLSVAICIKYADNIAKNFATSVAIILATIGSIYLFGFIPNIYFMIGTAFVIFSIFLYSSPSFILQLLGMETAPPVA